MTADKQTLVGLMVSHRRYVTQEAARFAERSVDSGYTLGLLSDVAAELCIRTDGDEGRFVGYQEVDFTAPIYAGDIVETEGEVIRVGSRSREIRFESRVLCRNARNLPDEVAHARPSSAQVLDDPLVVVRAIGTVVVPQTDPSYHEEDRKDRPVWGWAKRPAVDPAAEID